MPDAVAPGGLNHDTASALAAQQADKHRAAIRKFATEKGLTIAQLGKRIGLNTGNAFYNFLRGRSSALSVNTLIRICDCFPGTTLDQLTGRDIPPTGGTSGRDSMPFERVDSMKPPYVTSAAPLADLGNSLRSLRLAIDDLEHDCRRVSAAMAKLSSIA